jgi:hypothetical protein
MKMLEDNKVIRQQKTIRQTISRLKENLEKKKTCLDQQQEPFQQQYGDALKKCVKLFARPALSGSRLQVESASGEKENISAAGRAAGTVQPGAAAEEGGEDASKKLKMLETFKFFLQRESAGKGSKCVFDQV